MLALGLVFRRSFFLRRSGCGDARRRLNRLSLGLESLRPAHLQRQSEQEAAVRDAQPDGPRPLLTVSINTRLRWSEQVALRWRDVDLLAGHIRVARSKNGHSRSLPMNSVVRSVLLDIGAGRRRPDDPEEPVFKCSYTAADKFFPRAVDKARRALKVAGKDASGLENYTWHGNRHTFASRLVMAGVDLDGSGA
jgi:integrase